MNISDILHKIRVRVIFLEKFKEYAQLGAQFKENLL